MKKLHVRQLLISVVFSLIGLDFIVTGRGVYKLFHTEGPLVRLIGGLFLLNGLWLAFDLWRKSRSKTRAKGKRG